MKLIRLLGLGRTLVVGEIPLGRYQWVGRSGIPRFRGVRGGGETLPVAAASSVVPEARVGMRVQSRSYQTKSVRAVSIVTGTPTLEEKKPVVPVGGRSLKVGQVLQGWLARLVAAVRRRRNPFAAHGVVRGALGAAAQGSLRLDEVRVVRNDLSDTDFDVIPKAKAAASGGKSKTLAVESSAPVDLSMAGGGGGLELGGKPVVAVGGRR